MKCEYDCGQEANFILKNGKHCCSKSSNSCPKVRNKNSEKAKQRHKEGKAYEFTKDVSDRGRQTRRKYLSSLSFEKQGNKLRRETVFKEQNERCLICGISEWQNKKIKLHLDHIDGNHDNSKRENLRLICPNCHSQTITYCSKNINNGKKKVSDLEILSVYDKCQNIRQTLLELKLTPKAGNYKRINKLIRALGGTADTLDLSSSLARGESSNLSGPT